MFSLHTVRPMSKSLRVLSALLAYPDDALRSYVDEMAAILQQESALSAQRRTELQSLMTHLRDTDPLQCEAEYVALFDRGRSTSLHLFEHVHGESRDRGPAMIDLAQTYEKAGLFLAEGELPDYLPAVLEFVSTQPPREARAFLGEMSHIFNAMFGALQRPGGAGANGYASVLGALLELAGEKAQPVATEAEAPLDESWAEPAAFDGCSSKGQAGPGTTQPIQVVRRAGGSNPGVSA